MNSEPKPFASLSSGLLARKGAARPAMRPQGFGQIGGTLEDLGWNDMGFEPPRPVEAPEGNDSAEIVPAHPHNLAGLTPVDSPVHNQQAEIAGRLAAYDPADASDDDAADGAGIAGRLSAFDPGDAGDEIDDTAELYDPQADVEAELESEDPLAEAPLTVVEAEPLAFDEPEPAAAVDSQPMFAVKVKPTSTARRTSKPRAAAGSKAKAAFTLRLEAERHLKLRLACAVTSRSAQMLVTQALDALLDSMPELDAMAQKAKRKG